MLQLKNVVKDYVSGNNVTHALKGLSINFRRNEFVAILGPSGCGKTTLLNITGGLDRYTSGDLIIEGKSTKNYKDGDWDTYRNHSVGFVFQSYNLITHQSVLKNVELALTISGISKAERRQRAEKALELVGLGGLGKKKPNQMSGGQMQRVAIARALVNNPEIVMADEPTGALDSETSVQIMDILKEVAKDRLVIMVTHNPDLAKQYATRIITMKDGVVLTDSNPYSGETAKERELAHSKHEESKGKKKNSSMSFFTATGLSFSNLLSKLKRTILVTIAGSIGIIGVSAVLAVSQGVRDYINNMQDDMLSSYPVEVAEESVDYTSLLSGLSADQNKETFKFDPANPKIGLDSMIEYLMKAYSDLTNVKTNTINDELVDFINQIPEEAVYSIHSNYGIDPTNNIFAEWVSTPRYEGIEQKSETISLNGLTQRYIAELKTVKGFSKYSTYVNLFTDFMKEIPADKDYILSQYDYLGDSSYGEGVNDITLVVDSNTTLTDLVLAQMGFFEHDEFINIAKRAVKMNELPDDLSKEERDAKIAEIEAAYPYRREFEYSDIIGKEFIYLPQESIYSNGIVADGEIAVQGLLYAPMPYPYPPTMFCMISYDMEADVINATMFNVLTQEYGIHTFERTSPKPESVVSPKDYVCGTWEAYDDEGNRVYSLDFTGLPNIVLTDKDDNVTNLLGGVEETPITVKGFHYQAELNDEMKTNPEAFGGQRMRIASVLRLKESKSFGCLSRGAYYSHAFGEKFIADSNSEKASLTKDFKAYIGSPAEENAQYNAYVKFQYYDYNDDQNPVLKDGYASSLNGDLSSSFGDLFSAITGVNYLEADKTHLRSVCGYKAMEILDENEEVTGYDFAQLPYSIEIYPKSFAEKDVVTDHLERWNSDENIQVFKGTANEKTLSPSDRNELSYTDTIKLIITVINTLITTVTIALVSFTSLALVVSCFMIAVITYISVVERTKEIGIIRSVGGRKKDVSRLFIAETFMTGFFSGLFGIIMTYIFEIIFNTVMFSAFHIGGLANLTIWTALIMLGISILLSVLSGLIPSMKASNQDPVIALRSGE